MRIHRAIVLVTLLAIGPLVAGCAGNDLDLDKLDVFNLNAEKKLPGERKDLFPGGVPGVTQGIPPEYLPGQQQPVDAMQPAAESAPPAQTAAVQPVQEEKPKAKPKPKPRAASRPARVNVSAPQPEPVQPAQQQQQPAPWPAPNQSSSTSPWPATPAPGTFSKQ